MVQMFFTEHLDFFMQQKRSKRPLDTKLFRTFVPLKNVERFGCLQPQ